MKTYFCIFILTFWDTLFSCLQVQNLIKLRRLPILVTSLALSTCKILSVLLVVKAADVWGIAAYVCAGTLGAQACVSLRKHK